MSKQFKTGNRRVAGWKGLIGVLMLMGNTLWCGAGNVEIRHHPDQKVVVFGNGEMMMTLDYNGKCAVTRVDVRARNVITGAAGICSEIRTSQGTFSSARLDASPTVWVGKNAVRVAGIVYGDAQNRIKENWKFLVSGKNVILEIEREIKKELTVEEAAFPAFRFNDMNTWDAAFLGNGGVAWFYLFNEKLCTYGVHTDYAAFWNDQDNIGLKIVSSAPGKQIASTFSRSADDQLVFSLTAAETEMVPRYDADTKRRRFIRQKTDVWDPFVMKAGKSVQTLTITPTDFLEQYNRGSFAGVDGRKITNLLNTIARIGVIDSRHFGANSWHTPYGPICLHEQYIGELGIAVNDPNYIRGYKECLDFYRDHAIKPNGRVFSRWAYDNSDMMPGEVTPLGFYEAQWGYLLDSNTDLPINVCEIFHLSGDLNWVRTHKESCEAVLAYLLNRDTNRNHLVEMITDYHSDKKGSDWIDIMWASFENAFVNAKLYRALTEWAEVEELLGDQEKAAYYTDYAAQLRESFNKPLDEGGFWDPKNRWYVHWRDKDQSVHGNNLVTPVNFMAIAYGICEDPTRSKAILDKIEQQMTMENLFFWPICLYPYQTDEGLDYQYPFPYYENGDLFLSWGGVGVESYARYNPDLALKYVENVLKQYDKDGLAFQRYSRISQQGAGDDILAGNCLSVVGLYKGIYGINPRHNRLYLNPHLPEKLAGTELLYDYRNEQLKIGLAPGRYYIANDRFRITANTDFGFFATGSELFYFHSDQKSFSIAANPSEPTALSLEILSCQPDQITLTQTLSHPVKKVTYTVAHLKKNTLYTLTTDNKEVGRVNSGEEGKIRFDFEVGSLKSEIRIENSEFRNAK